MNKEYLEMEHYLNNLNKCLEELKKQEELTLDKLNVTLEELDFEDVSKDDIPYLNYLEYKKNDKEIYVYIDYTLKKDTDDFFNGGNKITIKKIEVEHIPPTRYEEQKFIYYVFKYYNNTRVELIAKFYNLEYAKDLLDYLETITKDTTIKFKIEDGLNIIKEI